MKSLLFFIGCVRCLLCIALFFSFVCPTKEKKQKKNAPRPQPVPHAPTSWARIRRRQYALAPQGWRAPQVWIGYCLALLLFPPLTYAAAPPTTSPWLTHVLGVIDSGIDFSKTLPATEGDCGPTLRAEQVDVTLKQLRQTVDTQANITEHARELGTFTVCQQNDVKLLERKMEDIRSAIIDAGRDCRLQSMNVLMDTYRFANGADASLRRGGTDPAYQDPLLKYQYSFESAEAFAEGTKRLPADAAIPLCPFNSDYLPTSHARDAAATSVDSYGCDIEVATNARTDAPLTETIAQPPFGESVALGKFLYATETFTFNMDQLLRTALDSLSSLYSIIHHGKTDPSLTIDEVSRPIPATHKHVTGCLKLPDLPDAFAEPLTADYLSDFMDASPPSSATVLPIGLLLRSAYQPFGLFSDSLVLVEAMVQKRAETFSAVALPPQMSKSDGESFDDYWNRNLALRGEWTAAAVSQAREGALADSWDRDAIERLQDAFDPVTPAIASLHAATDTTVPHFVRDLTFFLLRTCVDGYCTPRLDSVIKRVLNPYCTPYASGLYKDPDAAKKCFCLDPDANNYEWEDYAHYCKADFTPEDLEAIGKS